MDLNNPFCECGEPSRRQISGYNHPVPRGIHYVSNEGIYFFYMEERNSYGEQIQVPKNFCGEICPKLLYLIIQCPGLAANL